MAQRPDKTTSALTIDRKSEIESLITQWLSDQRIPGASLAIVEDDDLVYAEGFGARNLAVNTPATPDTLFGFGSCSKPFTATAIMQLAERGQLDVYDPVNDYLPHLAEAPGEPITIHELLSHTSGLPSDGMAVPVLTRPLGIGHVEVPMSSEADFRRHIQGSLDWRVTERETFFYYNSGYTLLGQIIETVSGQPFASYVDEHILDPLGMDRSTFDRATFEADEDRMTPYIKQEGGSSESEFPFDPVIHAPGGLVSSVAEMANFLRMHLGGGSFGGTTVLSPESLEAMATPVSTFGTDFDGRELGYGYGLIVEPFLGERLVGHGGSIGTSNAWFGYLSDAKMGTVVACTTSPEAHPTVVGPAILAMLQGEAPEESVPYYRLVSAVERASGAYAGYRNVLSATVERSGGMLRLNLDAGIMKQEVTLAPQHVATDGLVATAVSASGMQTEARFEFSEDGVDLFMDRNRLAKQ